MIFRNTASKAHGSLTIAVTYSDVSVNFLCKGRKAQKSLSRKAAGTIAP